MTECERTCAVDEILSWCHGNYTAFTAMQAAHALGYAVAEIGSAYLLKRLDEALAKRIFEERNAA